MADQNEIRREHDYVINYIKLVDFTGKEYDFTSHFAEFTYEESIFGHPHGTLVAVDAVDYPTLLPMFGEERLKASFTRPDENNPGQLLPSIIFDMPIYTLDGKSQDQGSRKRQVYNLRYIADSTFLNVGQRVFKAFKATKYSDMVQVIYDEKIGLKGIEIESTEYEVDYTVSNETPFGAIKKIADRSVSSEGNGTYFTFYEDRDSFYFTSLGKLIEKDPTHTIRYEVKNVLEHGSDVSHHDMTIERDLYNINQLSQGSTYDTLASAQSGELQSRLITFNPIRRKYEVVDHDLRNDFGKFKHMHPNKKWTDDGHPMFGQPGTNPKLAVTDKGNPAAPYIASHDPTIKQYFYEEYKLTRPSYKHQLLKHVTSVTMSGDPRFRAGDVLEFLLPEFLGKTSKENPEELDRYLQGKYLIISVAHIVKQGSYTLNMELIKDTFFNAILNRDPVEEYKNIM